MANKFYGPNEILEYKELEGDYVELEYKSGEKEVMTYDMYENGMTTEESDLTSLRERRLDPLVLEIMALILKYDVKPNEPMNEVNYLLHSIKRSYDDSAKRAVENKWGIKDENLKFSDIDKAIKND